MSNERTAVQRLADFSFGQVADPHTDAAADAKLRLLDTLGLMFPAIETGSGRAVIELAREWAGTESATAIGVAQKVPAPNAALVNGTLAHTLDFDDTHVPSISHPSASAVAAALAAAELAEASGRQLLSAIAVGNEITLRLGNAAYDPAIGNSIFFERGLHATSVCGALGSAAAAAVAMGLPAEQIAHAMAIAGSMGAGLLEANRAGGSVKRMHCGWAAHAGVVAAQAAAKGMTGPPTVLEGRFGFFNAYCGGQYDEAALLDGLGTEWAFGDCFVKPYPTNVFTHTGIDAAIALRQEGLEPEAIESVEIGVSSQVLRTIAEPRDAKIRPESGYHAQFSGPFTFALALRGGSGLGLYLDDFTDDVVTDPVNLDLAARVTHVADPIAQAQFPMHFASVVRVRMKDGRTITKEILHNRGTAARPLAPTEVEEKFRLNVSGHVNDPDALAKRIHTIEEVSRVPDFMAEATAN